MKVLWVCNVMLPVIAQQLNMEATNKEGWITGLADAVLEKKHENNIELSIAFPAPAKMFPENSQICRRVVTVGGTSFTCYGFLEDLNHAEIYKPALEDMLKKILEAVNPDLVHCFGTEYPHTLAMARVFPRKDRLLIGLQGLCTLCAEAYYANLPEKVIRSKTLRDHLRKDNIQQQQEKFVLRGIMEREAVGLVKNFTGRTEWDRTHSREWNPEANYYNMDEILRPEFYGQKWEAENCIPHSIFMSQGDYPLKGLHYMLTAMPTILSRYPDAMLYVAGNSIVNYKTLKQKLKISSYGKYLLKLMKQKKIRNRVVFLGKLTPEQMRDRYLKSNVFVCCSSLENSPNSLGEAMLMGMPCVAANVGGISSMFNHGEDGILFQGYKAPKKDAANLNDYNEKELKEISRRLAAAVIEMWSDPEKMESYCRSAKAHASRTHKKSRNYQKLMEIYVKIITESEG